MALRAAVMLTTQVAEAPVHGPDQPTKAEPEFGAAVSVTLVPDPKLAEQEGAHWMPAGLLLTVPLPPPSRPTVSW